jgi:transposase
MFYFGIDWSERFHVLCIRNEAGARISQLRFEPTAAGFAQIEAERRKLQTPAAECLVAIETAANLVVDYLLDRDYPIYIIPPQATDAYRNRQHSSGAHDDDSDAALLAGILRTDRASHRQWRPNSALTQQILAQVRLSESLRRSIQRQANQLRAVLVRTYPTALELFSDLTTQITLQFLAAYPTATEAQALSQAAFEQFCREHDYRRRDKLASSYAQLVAAQPTAAPAIAQAYRSQVRSLAEVLLVQVRNRTQAHRELAQLFVIHPDACIFASLPGAGELLAPALLAKFGDDRQRFPAAGDVQALAGTCPVTKRSGQRTVVQFRKGCDREFRRISQQFARASVTESGWAAAYWAEIRPHCTSDSHAYRILANRWLAIIWKLWQNRQTYDEAYHLQQRALRRKPRP